MTNLQSQFFIQFLYTPQKREYFHKYVIRSIDIDSLTVTYSTVSHFIIYHSTDRVLEILHDELVASYVLSMATDGMNIVCMCVCVFMFVCLN